MITQTFRLEQEYIIDQLKALCTKDKGIESAMLIGSWGRREGGIRSDVDIALLIDPRVFSAENFLQQILDKLSKPILGSTLQKKSGKIGVFFKEIPRLDILYFIEPAKFMKYVWGSRISDPWSCLWKDARQRITHILKTESYTSHVKIDREEIEERLASFLYYFEQASFAHFRSDTYRFYFLYNIALHEAIRLKAIARAHEAYNYLPPYIKSKIFERGTDTLELLEGSTSLAQGNEKKLQLLDFVKSFIQDIPFIQGQEEKILSTLASIYRRDFIWNFRDAALGVADMRKGKVFRSSSLTHYQHEDFFPILLSQNNISVLVDLRSHEEVKKSPYDYSQIKSLKLIHLPIDPYEQSEEFIKNHHIGTGIEIAYRFFLWDCKPQVKAWMEILSREEGILIHCHAGKDRTGFLVALLHLLLGVRKKDVLMEYLASGADTRAGYMEIIMEGVEQHGGIMSYLHSCGLDTETIEQIKQNYQP